MLYYYIVTTERKLNLKILRNIRYSISNEMSWMADAKACGRYALFYNYALIVSYFFYLFITIITIVLELL